MPPVPEHADDRLADRGALDYRADEIDKALRLRPLAKQLGPSQFLERDQIGGCNRLFEVSEKCRSRG
jgi:hypothetical protein